MINKGFSNDCSNIVLFPIFGGHFVLESHQLLKVEVFQLFGVLEENGNKYILDESKGFALSGLQRDEGIEQSKPCFNGELPEQQAGHPLKVDVIEVNILGLKICKEGRIDSLNDKLNMIE